MDSGLQVRKLVEVAADSFGLATRFEAELSIVADATAVCDQTVANVTARREAAGEMGPGEAPRSPRASAMIAKLFGSRKQLAGPKAGAFTSW